MLKLNGATDDGDYEESAEPAGGGGDERAGADEPNARAEIARPPNTTDADWAFYCMCAAAQASFDAKFHKVRECEAETELTSADLGLDVHGTDTSLLCVCGLRYIMCRLWAISSTRVSRNTTMAAAAAARSSE